MKGTIIRGILPHDWQQAASLRLKLWVAMIAAGTRPGIVLATTLGFPSVGLAHNEHGTGELTSVFHFLTEPVHILPILAMLLIGVCVLRRTAQRFSLVYQKRKL